MDETGGSVDPSGVGVATNTSSSLFNTTNLQIKRDYPYHNPGTLIRLGFVGNNGATASTPSTVPILMLGNTDDPNNTAAGGNSREAAPTTWLHYYPTGTVFPGWYGLTYTGAVNKAAFLLSTGAATIAGTHTGNDAGGYVMFPRGFFLSDLSNGTPSQGRRYAMNSAAPTSGTWIGGDFVFNQTTSLGGNLGWTATAGGTPGTWSKAGWIYSSVSGSGTQQLGATITTPSSGQVLQWDGSKWINSASAGALLGANQTFTGNQSITGTLTLGASGSAIALQKKASASLDFDLSATACQDLTIALTGATTGDTVGLGIPVGSVTTDTFFNAYVSAADTVTVRACRLSGTPNPSAGTFTVWLTK